MADINSELLSRHRAPVDQRTGKTDTPNADPQLVTFVELLFFAYRDFTREADALLAEFRLGRAHHRVLHFVNRHPGLRVADLLDILKITKQSLARVLKELVDEGWIVQMAGETDRRQRLLHATDKGAALSGRLDAMQARRVAQALEAAGGNGDMVARFLFAMITQEERGPVEMLLPGPVEAAASPRK
jgi:DNA-binding MarR family transcriptional regulator